MTSIFCLEGEWEASLTSKRSVLPVLDLLQRLDTAKYFHRDAAAKEEFEYYLKKLFRSAAATFPVVYLAAHGHEDGDGIWLGKDALSLADLGRMFAGRLEGRVLYFGSCLVGAVEEDQLQTLVKLTGAKCVVGYETEVDWHESAAFDVLLLARLMDAQRADVTFRSIVKQNESLARGLGLVFATKSRVYRAAGL